MKTCTSCGVENPDIARFCLACGTQLVEAAPAQEVRKVVTIVFSDLKGSTSLGEALDSEALREVMTRYFDAMRHELERHGGVIEKFIGDAVMAVFGLPRLHEDDALRAVRAAAGMQAALERLNVELDRVYGVQLANRTGVNTGEVVAGDPTSGQRLVTGDVVNVAARLEQAAGESEVLLGELTYRLVRESVDVEEVEPLELKGKSERVPAYRLVQVRERHATDARAAPMVGRDGELAQLESALDEAVATHSPRLVTIVGEAGVGKSRLTSEFVHAVSKRALTLSGRCLSYGDGITFWPVAEALRTEAGIGDDDGAAEARAKLAALTDPAGEGVTERLASAIGLSVEPFPVEELFWAVRRLLERLAQDGPVVFVVQDVHWAEPTLFGLLEHLVQSVAGPLLVVCPSRPDLLRDHPSWESKGTVLRLDALDATASEALIEAMLEGSVLSREVLDRIVGAAEGNPLYVQQLLQMLTEDGALELRDGTWEATGDLATIDVPPTIQALLASRLDSLAADERAVIEPASVVGYVFAESAVTALAPPEVEPQVPAKLGSLMHKQLVRYLEDGDEGMHRFDHIMIRDTAYDGILKRARADMHARFVAWADLTNRDRSVEFEEILGYHLEQAWRYLNELGQLDDRGREIGREGARRLAGAGRRAFARGDIPGAATLLGRAAAILPPDDRDRVELLPEHGEALLLTGRYEAAAAVLDEAVGYAATCPGAAARATLIRLLVWLRMGGPEGWKPDAVDRDITDAMTVCERAGDETGLAMAWRLRAWVAGIACRFEEAAEASESARMHARRAGDVRQERRAATAYGGAALLGPTTVDEAIARCETCIEQTAGDRQSEGQILVMLAGLYAMQGSIERAREHIARARSLFADLGLDVHAARTGLEAWRVEILAGEVDAAEQELRTVVDMLEAVGEKFLLSTVAGLLAQTLLDRGDDDLDEAEALGDRSRELATEDDVDSQALWRCVRGRVLSRRGRHAEAEELVREGITLLDATDATVLQIGANLDLGEVLRAAGRIDEARAAYEIVRQLAERKGGVVFLSAALQRLEELDAAPA